MKAEIKVTLPHSSLLGRDANCVERTVSPSRTRLALCCDQESPNFWPKSRSGAVVLCSQVPSWGRALRLPWWTPPPHTHTHSCGVPGSLQWPGTLAAFSGAPVLGEPAGWHWPGHWLRVPGRSCSPGIWSGAAVCGLARPHAPRVTEVTAGGQKVTAAVNRGPAGLLPSRGWARVRREEKQLGTENVP